MTKKAAVIAQTSFEDIRAAVTEQAMKETANQVINVFENRMRTENRLKPGNEGLQVKLAKAKARMSALGVCGVMIAANVDPDFVNREVNEGARYNIYAIDKLNDLMAGLCSGTFRNAVNIAIMKSLFQFRAAGVTFNGVAAQAACSDKIKVEKGMTAHLVRHTVSAATAPTQTSSSTNALQTLGVIKNVGTTKFPIWQLTDNPVTDRVAEILKVA